MSQKKMKELRRIIYGDMSHKSRNQMYYTDGSIRDTGLRRKYQDAKKKSAQK